MKNFKILVIFCIAALVSSFDLAPVNSNGATTTTVTQVSVDGKQFFIPCTGETVTMSGFVVLIAHVNQTPNGLNIHMMTNPQGVTGISNTGKHYVGTGNGQWHTINGGNGQSVINVINNFGLFGQSDSGAFLLGHGVYHLTINANNEITAEVDFEDFECR